MGWEGKNERESFFPSQSRLLTHLGKEGGAFSLFPKVDTAAAADRGKERGKKDSSFKCSNYPTYYSIQYFSK